MEMAGWQGGTLQRQARSEDGWREAPMGGGVGGSGDDWVGSWVGWRCRDGRGFGVGRIEAAWKPPEVARDHAGDHQTETGQVTSVLPVSW